VIAGGPITKEAIVAQAFDCADALASVIAAKAINRHYQPHSTILHAGDASGHVYLVIDGHAQAIAISADGRAVLVQDFHPGDLFGETAALSSGVNEEDVIAHSDVDASQFRNDIFIGLIETYSNVALAVSRLVVARLNRTTRRLVEGATLSANGRVYAELLRQGRKFGSVTEIRPLPVFSEFAMQVQSTRETVSRAINLLERKGIITRESDCLIIVAPHRLEDMIA
jgi:CRP/FNR family transcriptional regulator, cyclic AMP receptor protein